MMDLIQSCKDCSVKNIKTVDDIVNVGLCPKCSVKTIAYNRYYESNIPIEYWSLSMSDFKGPKNLFELYTTIVADLTGAYTTGLSFCLAGTHGVGKSTSITNVLKKACQKNFTTLYTSLSDIISALTIAPSADKYVARKELTEVDFLAIDEFDGRHIGATDNATDLFGRTFEYVVRTRLQNKLPTIVVSNSPNPVETFQGNIKDSLDSLMTKLPTIATIGPDQRKLQGSTL